MDYLEHQENETFRVTLGDAWGGFRGHLEGTCGFRGHLGGTWGGFEKGPSERQRAPRAPRAPRALRALRALQALRALRLQKDGKIRTYSTVSQQKVKLSRSERKATKMLIQ